MLRTVVAIAVPGVDPFELGVAHEVFGIDRSDTGGPCFDFRVATPDPGPVPLKGSLRLDVPDGLETADRADLVIALAYQHGYRPTDAVLDALRAAHARGAWVMSLCSGAFLLGAAGLLDGRRCTTHWMYADALARRFPRAVVDPGVLYVDDDRVITSAGTAAGIDACLHLVREELGAASAAVVARRMVVPPHRDGGQLQFVDVPLPCEAETLTPLLAWLAEHLDAQVDVADLAARALMSPRTFARRFRAETGTTPGHWLIRQRLSRAQLLLETTTLGIDDVAAQAGFGTAAALRHHFTRVLATTPVAYRRRFADADALPVG